MSPNPTDYNIVTCTMLCSTIAYTITLRVAHRVTGTTHSSAITHWSYGSLDSAYKHPCLFVLRTYDGSGVRAKS
jgi:hypothetical protein